MSNEELAARIRAGERDRLPELWEQVERFVRRQAARRAYALDGRGGVTAEDLYQAGYLALVAAVGSYDPAAGGSFIGWLALYLKTAFAEAGGYRTKKQAQDPINRALSLDTPLSDDPDAGTLEDIVEDPAGLQGIQDVEERMDRQRLHSALERALAAIPEDQSAVIRLKYYQGQDVNRGAHAAALRSLRHPRISRELKGYGGS